MIERQQCLSLTDLKTPDVVHYEYLLLEDFYHGTSVVVTVGTLKQDLLVFTGYVNSGIYFWLSFGTVGHVILFTFAVHEDGYSGTVQRCFRPFCVRCNGEGCVLAADSEPGRMTRLLTCVHCDGSGKVP